MPNNVQTFNQFVEQYQPLWGDPARSYVFHRDDPRVNQKNVLAQRVQLSGLCYIHAPDMLQHYLVSMNTPQSAPMIDISRMIRERFTAIKLEKHIFEDAGDNAFLMLIYILQHGSHILGAGIDQIEQRLREYGPILISYFEVHEDFEAVDRCIYHGDHVGALRGGHSMLIIGVRIENNRKYFLLQNWWQRKQFIEVDGEYLISCNAEFHYVRTPQLSIPNEFPTYFAIFAVNHLDKPVSHPTPPVGPIKGMFEF